MTQPYTAELAAYAPPDARTPAPATMLDQAENDVGQYWLLGLFVTVAVAIVVAVVMRRRVK